ncbi:MAG TPA: ferredoxin family protein [Candidatus Acetothermia bacterium]|nr:ferredoxin family protein [Candidatus Acetothermia bacterium]
MPSGKVVIDRERCKGCGLCVGVCPFGVLELSATHNSSGYPVVSAAHPEKCTGCALCAQTCPDVALEVYREKAVVSSGVGGSAEPSADHR